MTGKCLAETSFGGARQMGLIPSPHLMRAHLDRADELFDDKSRMIYFGNEANHPVSF